ncbi:MAG: 3-hydroxyacyl-CoA dehydrogenase/enoyl-CoA hydratase family protein [Acidobacteria bacterium]|nr:3-hydroxyacyl-CoA dehydrogenase/enoyl-CoA hydratase family protein [Acidobacteriota bacterium]
MNRRIEKVAVLGAGTMGARIAAHLANAGVNCFLLDIVPPDGGDRNRIVNAGLEAARKARPAAFFRPANAALVRAGNFEDNMAWCGEADWIIEAVAENLGIKRKLFEKVEQHRKPGTPVSSNTSGLPIRLIAEGRSADFQQHWCGTHFFNPPRYMKLVEIIPGPQTKPDVISALDEFCDRRLGKGVVIAKDTPNFIANRIGTYSMLNVLRLMREMDMTIEEIDACTGPAVGWPKSATFRTTDIVGLDVLAHVVRNIYENVPDDESREAYRVPPLVEDMMTRGWLGEKTGGGFYKRVKGPGEREILTLDWKTMEYRPRQKAKFASIEQGKTIEDTGARLRMLLTAGDKASKFLWASVSEMCCYAARRVPEIADRIVDVDRAMKWGFAWELGPFEIWDAMGEGWAAERLKSEGRPVPELLSKLHAAENKPFYDSAAGRTKYFDVASASYKPVEDAPGIIFLKALKDQAKVVEKNSGASLIDLGDGVVCCEFQTKMNAIGGDIVSMLHKGIARLKTDFEAMVIANQATNFSVGANIAMLLMAAQEQEWDDVHMAVRQFQNVNLALKYAPKPVVAAPHGMSLGGGCEIPLQCARIQAAAESYIGLVETGVGLIPAGGGTKEMMIRANEKAGVSLAMAAGGSAADAGAAMEKDLDLFHAMKPVFETIAMAKVGTSAEESRDLGFLRAADAISMNRDRLVSDAKQTALNLIRSGWRPLASSPAEGAAATQIRVLGEQLIAGAKLAVHQMLRGEFVSEYDAVVAGKLAHVLAGGALTSPQFVSEQYVLDLEREAFVSLCGQRKTLERIGHTLKTGKPLRN